MTHMAIVSYGTVSVNTGTTAGFSACRAAAERGPFSCRYVGRVIRSMPM
jgi:hypothetical protein